MLWDTKVKDEDGHSIFIPRGTASGYLTEYFWGALEVYGFTQTMECLPFSGGWAEQPVEITTILAVLKTEANRIEQEEWDRRTGKHTGNDR